ncbi:MAG: toprim domain-containing protein [Hyphomicrobiaceae bacterium]
MAAPHRTIRREPTPKTTPAIITRASTDREAQGERPTTSQNATDPVAGRAEKAAARATRIWSTARPAPPDHPYLVAKHVAPLALRIDASGQLIVPLQDISGRLHSLETIASDGAKRFLAGGAKRGHFAVVGAEPAPLSTPSGPLLICEGWATGASLHQATGHRVIAAMDAGNLLPVAEALRAQFPEADLVLIADNDLKPDRDANPGVVSARKAALAVDARLAVPASPGDANDLFATAGPEAVAALVAGAVRVPPPPPTYPAPNLTPDEARAHLAEAISTFMAAVPKYWTAVEAARAAAQETDQHRSTLDFNDLALAALPPLLGLPVDVGLGKTSTARTAIAALRLGRAWWAQGRLRGPAARSWSRTGRRLHRSRSAGHALERPHVTRPHA